MSDGSADPRLRCVLADDVVVLRDVTRMLVESLGWAEVCAEADDGAAALAALEALRPDIALLDQRMPELTGFEVAARVRELGIPMAIIVFSAFETEGNLALARQLDVDFVSKLDGVPALVAALQRARTTLRTPVA
ncbi:MAG: response regulator receiver protein [Thermoleophilia bacterium]|nr:response regulator receiver protein [Thermoleophilia bacterium]